VRTIWGMPWVDCCCCVVLPQIQRPESTTPHATLCIWMIVFRQDRSTETVESTQCCPSLFVRRQQPTASNHYHLLHCNLLWPRAETDGLVKENQSKGTSESILISTPFLAIDRSYYAGHP